MLESILSTPEIAVYKIIDDQIKHVNRYIVSTQNTREICNDIQISGREFTRKLQKACEDILNAFPSFLTTELIEANAMVLNIMRNGLTFRLADAIYNTFGWNNPTVTFFYPCDSIRGKNPIDHSENSTTWSIPTNQQIILGTVVENGKSLEKALLQLIEETKRNNKSISDIICIVFGSINAEEVLSRIAHLCQESFKEFNGIDLIYLESRFNTPTSDTELSIKKEGEDLVRLKSLMAPEFLISQYELPYYPLERSALYDAGNRAYDIQMYFEDIIQYWEEVRHLATNEVTFEELLKERFPEIDASKFGKQNLMSLVDQHLSHIRKILMEQSTQKIE